MISKQIYIAVLCCSGVFVCTAQSSTTAHPERYEFETFQFQFDGVTGLVAVHQKDVCYLWQLTQSEHDQIHTDNGLRTIEVRILHDIEDAMYTVVPKAILNPSLIRSCSLQAKHFYIVH